MTFVRIIEFTTARIGEGRPHIEAWERATEGRRPARRSVLCRDRETPDRYVNILFFDDFDSAMATAQMPETQELAETLEDIVGGPGVFYNLDVIDDRS